MGKTEKLDLLSNLIGGKYQVYSFRFFCSDMIFKYLWNQWINKIELKMILYFFLMLCSALLSCAQWCTYFIRAIFFYTQTKLLGGFKDSTHPTFSYSKAHERTVWAECGWIMLHIRWEFFPSEKWKGNLKPKSFVPLSIIALPDPSSAIWQDENSIHLYLCFDCM